MGCHTLSDASSPQSTSRQRKTKAGENPNAVTPLTPERTNHILLHTEESCSGITRLSKAPIFYLRLSDYSNSEMSQPQTRRFAKSPLLLLPMVIEESPKDAAYTISALETEPELNLTLAEKLAQEYGYELPREWDFDLPDALTLYLGEEGNRLGPTGLAGLRQKFCGPFSVSQDSNVPGSRRSPGKRRKTTT